MPRLCFVLLAAVMCVACRAPTELTFELTTDVPCGSMRGSTVTVGTPDGVEGKAVTASSPVCGSDGHLGALVVVPSGERNETVGLKIIAGVNRDPATCVAPTYGPGCIVARRSLRFVPHTALTLAVPLRAACDGIACTPDSTCVDGTCRAAQIDPESCASARCDETNLPPLNTLPPTPMADAGAVDATVSDATADATIADATTDASPVADVAAEAGAPLSSPTAFVGSRIWEGVGVQWSPPLGWTPLGYILIARTGLAVSFIPVDGTTYATGAVDSDNTLVTVIEGSSGPTVSTVETGLTLGVNYHYAVFAYDASHRYSVPLTGSVTPARWKPMTTAGAPSGRRMPTYAWTGATGNVATANRLIVWGGQASDGSVLGNGGIYDPATDTWTTMSSVNAPSARRWQFAHSIWTGNDPDPGVSNRMVVWGGLDGAGSAVGTGAVYDVETDTWTTIATPATGPAATDQFAAVWTGSSSKTMYLWGGTSGENSAFALPLTTLQWTPGSAPLAPPGRTYASAVWTGDAPNNGAPASRLIVWGGQLTNVGGIWDGSAWIATSLVGAPSPRRWHGAVYTGNTGNPLSTNRMIIWGGYDGSMLGDGAIYDPKSDTWSPMSSINAPVPSATGQSITYDLGAFWTGDKMIIMAWQSVKTYDPVTDIWSSFDDVGVQGIARYGAKAWTGTNLIVWGGETYLQAGSIAYP